MRSKPLIPLILCLVAGLAPVYSPAMSDDKAADMRIAAMDTLFHDFNQPDSPGAAVAVIRDGAVVFKKAYGLANLEDRAPVTTATNFRLASFSKQFTAMAIMILADRGQLSLDAPLTDFFPEFPAWGRAITVRHLLTHTSGLPDYEDVIPEGTTIPVLDRDVLWILAQQPAPRFPPGSRYAYSNSGYAVLAMIVERVSGETFAAFQKKHIFDPLGMNATLVNERGVSAIPRRALGYAVADKSVADEGVAESTFVPRDHSLTSYVQGDGGVYSSIDDLVKWDAALYTDRLVSRALLEQAFAPGPFPIPPAATLDDAATTTSAPLSPTPPAAAAPARTYGFGWNIDHYRGERCLWHSGTTSGFRTLIKRFPDRRVTVIILTNRNQPNGGAILETLSRKIADMWLFESERP